MSYKYKNVTDHDLHLVGHGIVKAGETVESNEVIVNPNFQKVSSSATQATTTSTPSVENTNKEVTN